MTIQRIVCLALVGSLGLAAFGDEFAEDRALLAAAAGERGDGVSEAGAKAADDDGEVARVATPAQVERLLLNVREDLVKARGAWRENRFTDAATWSVEVLQRLRQLPADVDATVHALQAEGLIARAEKMGIDVEAIRVAAGLRGASAERDRDVIPQRDTQRRRAAANRYGTRPSGEVLDAEVLREGHTDSAYPERMLHEAHGSGGLGVADGSRVVSDGWLSYPPNWPEISAKREKYKGGRVAKSETWRDETGRDWYAAVYDLRELTYVPPDFTPDVELIPSVELRNRLDRHAIRYQSDIFRGRPEDLAMGIPLLRYFGGVDSFAFRGEKYSAAKQREIIEMIRAFSEGGEHVGKPRMVPLSP